MEAENYPKKIILCACGKSEHDEDTIYCTSCGKKLEEAAPTTSSVENHL